MAARSVRRGHRLRLGGVVLVASLGLVASVAPLTPVLAAEPTVTDQSGPDGGPAAPAGPVGTDLSLAVVVDDPGDSVDVAPGDGACADALGACTLRAAVIETNAHPSADTITFAPGLATVQLGLAGLDEDDAATGDLDITDDLSIDGAGSAVVAATALVPGPITFADPLPCNIPGCQFQVVRAIEHQTLDSAISVRGGAQVVLTGLQFAAMVPRDAVVDVVDGHATLDQVSTDQVAPGRAVLRNADQATVARSELVGDIGATHCAARLVFDGSCTATGAYGLEAAAAQVTGGSLIVTDSTVQGRRAALEVAVGSTEVRRSLLTAPASAVVTPVTNSIALRQESGSATVVSSTIEGAGAIDQRGGVATITASTVEAHDFLPTPAIQNVTNLMLHGSWVGAACAERPATLGWNADADGSCVGGSPQDRPGVPGLLGLLVDNGGPTATRLPAVNSPLVDAVPVGTVGLCDGAISVDQRGAARPAGTACDIGAVEGSGPVQDVPLTMRVDTTADDRDLRPGDSSCRTAMGHCSLRAAIDEANALPAADTITFAPGLGPVVLTRAGAGEDANATGDLDIAADVTIDGGGTVTVDGAGLDRVLDHHGGVLHLRGVTVTGGSLSVPGAVGAGVAVQAGTAMLDGVVVRANTLTGANASGAGLAVVAGTVSVDGSRFEDNVSTGAHATGVAIHQASGTVTVRTTTIVGNRATDPTADGAGLYVVTGSASIANSTIVGNRANRGVALYRYGGTVTATSVTVADNVGSESVIAIAGLTLTATVIDAPGWACWGAVASGGYNVVTDSTCRLAATGDRSDTAPGLAPLAAVGPIASGRAPTQRSTFADAIPAGTVGLCDGTTPADLAGQARPGTVAGCTAGALEEVVPTRFDLVVDDPGDAPDATPGDERCATAAGSCTLRAAIDEANADPVPDRIVVTAGVDPVLALAGADDDTNATGDLDVLTPVTIVGAGATLDAAGIDRALDVAVDPAAGEVVVDELHLTGGAAVERGAGLRLRVGTATLRNSHVHHNTATSAAGAAEGGGAAVEATATRLTVEGSTFEGNRAESAAGPARGGGLAAEAAFVVRTSTFVGNAADGPGSAGGALAVPRGRASAHITASTVAGNAAETGAGVAVADGPFGVTASILDNGPDCAVLGSGRFNAFFSLDASGSCGFGAVYNLSNVDPLLGPLGLSGGPTPVRRPLAASPVIELIPVGQFGCTTTDPSTDQLGGPRPLGERCDAGAVEGDPAGSLGLSLVVDTAADGHDANPGDRICATAAGACSLRAAVDETNASRYPDLITIAPGIDPVLSIPRSSMLSAVNLEGGIHSTDALTIRGQGATIDAAGLDRVLGSSAPLVLTDLTLTGGSNPFDGTHSGDGGGVFATARLTLDRVTIRGNSALSGGGIHFASFSDEDTLTVRNSTISGNDAFSGGGLRFESNVDTANVIERSTFEANTATANGGNIWVGAGRLDVASSSVTGGDAPEGAGLWHVKGFSPTSPDLVLRATVLANVGADCSAPLTSLGWNRAHDTTCLLPQPTDASGVDPLLGPLADNGGPTPTRMPGAGSPVIDLVPFGVVGLCDASTPTDQRGRPRPLGSGCDSGAVEAPVVPGAPTAIAAVAGDAQATVTWVAPAADGDEPITSYVVTAAPSGVTCTWTAGPLSCVVTGLPNGTPVTFTVHAVNEVGPGPESEPSEPVTPATVPGAPGELSAVAGKQAAVVSWAAPVDDGGAPITGYTITSAPGGATCTWTTGPLTCTVTGLPAGTAVTFTARAVNRVGPGPVSGASGPVTPWDGAGYHPVTPTRILDSRGPVGGWNGRLQSGGPRALTVTDLGGDANVPASATAVVLNVTATNASAGSFLTAYPTGTATPNASNLNFGAGQTIANLVTVKIGANGRVTFANAVGATDVIADVVGYYDDGTGPGDLFTGITPTRLLDSRGATGGWNGSLAAGTARDLVVRQPGNGAGVPATATAVIANITVTNSNAGSFVSVWPSGVTQPNVSNLNFATGQTIPNLAIVKIGANGAIRFANFVGSVDVIVDVVGYFDPTGGSRFHAINPTRVLDSRVPTGLSGPWGPGITRVLGVAGGSGTNVPASATGLVANVTATAGTAGSFVTVFPDGVAVPNSSNVNFGAGETIPNLVTVKIGFGGRVAFFNKLGSVHLIADAVGYYAPT